MEASRRLVKTNQDFCSIDSSLSRDYLRNHCLFLLVTVCGLCLHMNVK